MDALTEFLNNLLSQSGNGFAPTSILLATVTAFIGGLLSSLTPCVYPMIPITIGVIGGMSSTQETKTRLLKPILFRALFYIGGMTLVYSALGVLAGLTGKLFGSLTNSPGWYLGLGIFMTLSALIMLDVIPFDPEAWWDRLWRRKSHPMHASNTHSEMTMLGALVLGASSGLIASPCTTPALSVILGFIAKTQSVGFGLMLMVSFSLGLSSILLLIASFTGALQVLPRSGAWLKTVKILSGLLILAFAEYLIYRSGKLGGF